MAVVRAAANSAISRHGREVIARANGLRRIARETRTLNEDGATIGCDVAGRRPARVAEALRVRARRRFVARVGRTGHLGTMDNARTLCQPSAILSNHCIGASNRLRVLLTLAALLPALAWAQSPAELIDLPRDLNDMFDVIDKPAGMRLSIPSMPDDVTVPSCASRTSAARTA